MASMAISGSTVVSVEQRNKKHYQLSLTNGQQLELAVVDMFNVHVMHAGKSVACATFQPLSSLNNIEMQPMYRMVAFEDGEGGTLDSWLPLLESVFAVYAYYTNGTIRPWRQALK